ncbi:MAG TPA: hypothetical protein VGI82_02470 [Chitinophagaceae bacterium]
MNAEYADNFNRQIFSIYNKLIEPDNLMETAKMIEKNKDMIIELFNLISQLNVTLREYYTPHLGIQLGKASRLMEQIKMQYNIRDTKKDG